jgi:hypothetical protein
MFNKGGFTELWDSRVSYKLTLGLGIVKTFDCRLITTALGSVPVPAGFVTNKVVMDTAGLPIALSPLLPTDLMKDWECN